MFIIVKMKDPERYMACKLALEQIAEDRDKMYALIAKPNHLYWALTRIMALVYDIPQLINPHQKDKIKDHLISRSVAMNIDYFQDIELLITDSLPKRDPKTEGETVCLNTETKEVYGW